MTDYERGKQYGELVRDMRAEGDSVDPRWTFADEAKAGTLAEFKRGFMDGMSPL